MARPIIGLISLVLLAAAILFQFFIILSGAILSSPERQIFFLLADTSGMNAPNPARWTYWSVCGADSNGKYNDKCGAIVPALPFAPANRHNFNSDSGVPDEFLNSHKYYYLSRFAWVFYLMALLFAVFAFLTSGLALCTRIGAWVSALNTFFALFWQSLAAALMTAWTVKARNVFRKNGHDASLGKYAYGFTWASVALLFLATLTFCIAGGHKRERRDHIDTTTTRRRRGFFGRRRSVRKEYV